MSQNKGAVVWSLALHVAVLGILATGITLPRETRIEVAAAPIVGTLVDTATLERQQQAREEAARQERQRQQREERQRREAVEQQQREEQRVAAEQRARQEAEQKERDRVAAEKAAQERREEQARAERERQAAAEKERQAQAQREREEAAKRERERAAAAAAQKRREDELAQAAALEAQANAAREAGLYDQYVFAIQQRIRSKWQRPLSARPGIDCVVTVTQLQSGVVVDAKIASCNGDDAVRASIERAVLAASPLPTAPSPGLYERIVNVRFKPEE
jgi:colicin import membrane protein